MNIFKRLKNLWAISELPNKVDNEKMQWVLWPKEDKKTPLISKILKPRKEAQIIDIKEYLDDIPTLK